ncbi:MAG: RNA polymerase sigma factor [Ignavibacteriales bacterium]|nr:RNA polymerase sigma factor [Ignavibacteriales bacterium]
MQVLSDKEVATRLRGGDVEAFAELYKRYHSRVRRFALKLLRDPSAADDIAQETFMKAQKGVGTLRSASSLRSWLFSIARNEVYIHFRKTRGNGRIREEDIWSGETPHEDMVNSETVEIVRGMIALLKPDYREVLILREYEQLSYSEIAEVTGDTESSVKSRLFKARKTLLKKLKPYFGGKE